MAPKREISIKDIKVDDSFWNGRIGNAVEKAVPYQWRVLNDQEPGAVPSHAVINFKICAGLAEGKFGGFRFQDSDLAKWIEAAAYSLLYKDSPEIRAALEEVVSVIEKAQQPDGYLDTYFILEKPEERWRDIAHGHELYCAGHMLEAAVALFQVTGSSRLLQVMEKTVNLIRQVFGEGEGQLSSCPGHEEIELALMKAYRATGQEAYKELALYFIENRGAKPGFLEEPGFQNASKNRWFQASYHQAHARIREQETAEGHAVRAMYFFTGAADAALETGDPTLKAALEKLWENVTRRRMYVTGGVGSQGEGECFTIDYDLPNDTCYTETCAAIGLAMWALRMLRLEPKEEYAAIMERALYNNVLSGISQDGEHYFYVNPLLVKPEVARFRRDHQDVEPDRVKWFGCACCPPNITRTLCGLGGYIYTRKGDAIYQHLYIGNTGEFETEQGKARLRCVSSMPWEGKAEITYSGPAGVEVYLRVPGYGENFRITKAGVPVSFTLSQGYARLCPQDGDVYTLSFDMKAQYLQANPQVLEDCGKACVQRGPLVYCAEEADNGPLLNSFTADLSQPPVLETSPLFGGVTVVKAAGSQIDWEKWPANALYAPAPAPVRPASLTLVPYFLWNNRGAGEMLVWMNAR